MSVCNKGCPFFEVVLMTAFNHTHFLFLSLYIWAADKKSQVPVGSSTNTPCLQGILTLAPCPNHCKTPSLSHFLTLSIHFQSCLGATIFFIR